VYKRQELWDKILVTQIETGMPYMTYKDSVNIKNNQKNIGTIQSSNLCVTPDTFILTDKGYKPIGILENQEVKVWNSKNFSKTTIKKTGNNKKILSISLSNGITLKTTEYHNFYINKNGKNVKVPANMLKMNDSLILSEYPLLSDCYYNREVNDNLENIEESIVPYNYSNLIKKEWLSNFFKQNIKKNKVFFDSYRNLIYTHDDPLTEYFLIELKYLFNTIGIDVVINNGNIVMHSRYIYKLKDFLQEIHLCDVLFVNIPEYHISFKESFFDIKVLGVVDNNFYSDTYCFTEEELGLGIFNGILTGQCNEINIYSDTTEYSCCNLASISLPAFIDKEKNDIDYSRLENVVGQIVINMNKIIDNNFYPVPETKKSNIRHRPIGIGVQGFADLLYTLKSPFESERTKELNLKIFETIYYAAIKMSCELAKKEGSYSTFQGSPFSKGIFQFDYYKDSQRLLSGRYDWESLKKDVISNGVRNSLLTACMPTASTASILNNFESFEPATHNLFVRKVLSGEYAIVNKYLIKDLMELKIWNNTFYNKFKASYGSIQDLDNIPENLRMLYKDVYEIPQKVLVDLSADRQAFIDQSQSLNVYFKNPTIKKLTSMHFYGWKKGLKTGLYYLRSSSAADSAQFTVSQETELTLEEQKLMCSIENKEACEMCSG
jgi:ribonucleotide reductase alpha subunit